MQFYIHKDLYDTGAPLFKKSRITIQPGLTVLVGCNGYGKSTLLKEIERSCNNRDIPCFKHDNYASNPKNGFGDDLYFGRERSMELFATSLTSSEGENIRLSLGYKVAGRLGNFVLKENKDAEDVVILFDAVDSGFSIDNIMEMKRDLFGTIFENRSEDQNVYIIVSANTYAMVKGEQCFDVHEGKYITFDSYENYESFVLKTGELKQAREESVKERGDED